MTSNGEKGFFEDWPTWAKPTLALAALVFIGGIWVGLPVLSALKLVDANAQSSGVANYGPMMTVFIGMTTATITGIFLFMTLRIDRGTRLKAESTAEKTVKEMHKKIAMKLNEITEESAATLELTKEHGEKTRDIANDARTEIDRALQQAADEFRTRFSEETRPAVVREAVSSKITEEMMRRHVEAVLMVTANGAIVKEYASKRAAELNLKSIEQLLGVMKETVKILSQHSKEKRKAEKVGFWARLFNK